MPHGRHIYAKASDMTKATMCTYPQYDHTLPYCRLTVANSIKKNVCTLQGRVWL